LGQLALFLISDMLGHFTPADSWPVSFSVLTILKLLQRPISRKRISCTCARIKMVL